MTKDELNAYNLGLDTALDLMATSSGRIWRSANLSPIRRERFCELISALEEAVEALRLTGEPAA